MKLQIRDETGPLTEVVIQNGNVITPPLSLRTRSVNLNQIVQLTPVMIYDATDLNVTAKRNKVGDERVITAAMMGQEGMPAWGTQEGAAAFKIDKNNGVLFTGAGVARVVLSWPYIAADKTMKSVLIPAQFAVAAAPGAAVPAAAPPMLTPAVAVKVPVQEQPVAETQKQILSTFPWKTVIIGGGAAVLFGIGLWVAKRMKGGSPARAMAGAGDDPKIVRLRRIVAEHQAAKVGGRMVDVQTANAIVKVYDNLSPTNQEKFTSVPITRMADVAWKLVTFKSAR